MRKLLLVIFIYSVSLQVSGQELTFSEPTRLGPQINTEDEEMAPLLSSDGETIYFSRAFHENNKGGKFTGSDIWVSKKDNKGNWMPASNVGIPWNNKRSNAVIGSNRDHKVVYLLNAYSNRSGISFSKLSNGAWGDPEFIPIPGINQDDFVGLYVHPEFDVILISMKGKDSFGEEDMYISLQDSLGKWSEPKNLGSTINTKGFEISPFLSRDKKRLFFSSNGHPGFGDADIFESTRLYDSWSVWSKPRNLGPVINSEKFDAYFSLYGDSVSFFSSNRNGGFSEIYNTHVQVTEDKTDEKVREILSEAKTILTDLKSAGGETQQSIKFFYKSKLVDMEPESAMRFTKVIEEIKKVKSKEVAVVAFSSEFDSESLNRDISEKRLERIANAFKSIAGLSLTRTIVPKPQNPQDSGLKSWVEVQYK